jgi:hypothetical protein
VTQYLSLGGAVAALLGIAPHHDFWPDPDCSASGGEAPVPVLTVWSRDHRSNWRQAWAVLVVLKDVTTTSPTD